MKVLIIEDEPSMREILERALTKERFVVETAEDCSSAMRKFGVYDYDCILLDIMLPDGNGLELLQQIKKMGKKDRVLIISAKDSIDDKVTGLNLGADDYLAKPFHIEELVARVKSLIRRNNNSQIRLSFTNINIDESAFQAFVDDRPLDLSRKEYDILLFFMYRPNRLIHKEALAENVWGDHIDQTDNFDFIYAQIKNVRKKLSESGASAEIKSVYGFGYKFVET